MGGYKFTGLGAGSAATDSANLGQVQTAITSFAGTSGGSANAQTLTPTPAIAALATGQSWNFIAGFTNTAAMTFAVSGLTAKNVFIGTVALVGGEIIVGNRYNITYDGTQYQLGFNMSFLNSGTGAVSRTGQSKLRDVAHAKDFGVTYDGVTNDTTALFNFYTYLIANPQVYGYHGGGTCLVTPGVLAFDTAFTNKSFPTVFTPGHNQLTFKTASSVDAPLLSFTNGTANSPAFSGWIGGYHGGITFQDLTGDTAANRHGLMLRGLRDTQFGYIASASLPGDTIRLEQKLYTGNNPDPYNVASCLFFGVEGASNKGMVFNNDNYVGFVENYIHNIVGILNIGGVFRGYGAGNTVGMISSGDNKGWTMDDDDGVGASAHSFRLLNSIELDNNENGIRIRGLSNYYIAPVRVKQRFNVSPNVSDGYWPKKAFSLGATINAVPPNTFGGETNLVFQPQTGGTRADLVGKCVDFNSAGGNIENARIQAHVTDDGGLGVLDTDLYANFNANSKASLKRADKVILSTLRTPTVALAAPVSSTVLNNGYGTNTALITCSVVLSDSYACTASSKATIVVAGAYRMSATLMMALPTGTRVRMGLFTNDGANALIEGIVYSGSASANQSYTITGTAVLAVGDVVGLHADQNNAASENLTASINASANNQWSMELV